MNIGTIVSVGGIRPTTPQLATVREWAEFNASGMSARPVPFLYIPASASGEPILAKVSIRPLSASQPHYIVPLGV